MALWFVLQVARHEARINPDPASSRASAGSTSISGAAGQPDTYDPEMHRFAAKLEAAQGPRGADD